VSGYFARMGRPGESHRVQMALQGTQATVSAEQQRQGDWAQWRVFIHAARGWDGEGGNRPDSECWALGPCVTQPCPTAEEWLAFVEFSREHRATYQAACNNVQRVVNVGINLRMQHDQRMLRRAGRTCIVTREQYDPRVLYSQQHMTLKTLLRRDMGMQVQKTEPLTVQEAKSGHNFTDPWCLQGWLMAASFNIGNTSGGRRPRSVSSLRVGDVQVISTVLRNRAAAVRVPSMRFTWADEKVMDTRGSRLTFENFSGMSQAEYDEVAPMSASFYLFRVLLARGCFMHSDPLLAVGAGAVVPFRPECLSDYVFCDTDGHTWFGAVPVLPSTLSNWTRVITQRMAPSVGGPPAGRGYRAHRYAAGTNPTVMSMLQRQGVGVDPGLERAQKRWGGWMPHMGTLTVEQTYESTAVDEYVNVWALAYGLETAGTMWRERLRSFKGGVLRPGQPVATADLQPYPWQVLLAAYRDTAVVRQQASLRAAASAALRHALADRRITPVGRSRAPRAALNELLAHPSSTAARRLAHAYHDARSRLHIAVLKALLGQQQAFQCAARQWAAGVGHAWAASADLMHWGCVTQSMHDCLTRPGAGSPTDLVTVGAFQFPAAPPA
jgi:hypothetical protein